MRLNKFVAEATGLSRRQADDAISEGRVSIGGKTAILGQRVERSDKVSLDGKPVTSQDYVYVLLNKPIGYVCSRKQQDDKPTIYSLLPEEYQGLKTAGRLDADSHGLILLTNDGSFAHQMMHPSFSKTKVYEAELDKPISDDHFKAINDGVKLEDGVSKFGLEKQGSKLIITMREGRNRQIRRTFEALGYTVTDLNRVSFGEYTLEELDGDVFLVVSKKSVMDNT